MTVTADDDRVVFAEEHIAARWLWVLGGLFAGPAVASGAVFGAATGSVLGLAVGGCGGGLVFVLPFLAVLAVSRYRSVAVDLRTGDVEAATVWRAWGVRATTFPAASVRSVVCERVPDPEGGTDGLRVALVTTDGRRKVLVGRAAYTADAIAHLRRAFGDKLAAD